MTSSQMLHGLLWLCLAVLPVLPGHSTAEIRVSLVTVGPGAESWQAFGHNALWISDSKRNWNASYNFGYFDFEAPNFILNFLRGRMQYRLAAVPADADVAGYIAANRSVRVQHLSLTQPEARRLLEMLELLRQPENSVYLYDYFRQNCSTKVRDVLDEVLQGRVRKGLSAPSGHTLRSSMSEYSKALPWMHLGVNLALGKPIDQRLDEWALFYLPDHFSMALHTASSDPDNALAGLITASDTLYEATEAGSTWWQWLALATVWCALATAAFRSRLVGTIWAFVSGLVGVLMLGIWAGTDHWAAASNPAILFFNPALLLWPWSDGRRLYALAPWVAIGMLAGMVFSNGYVQFGTAMAQTLVLGAAFARTRSTISL